MNYIKVSDASAKWGISVHRVQELCRRGRVAGALRFGRDWMIPENAEKPIDSRYKSAKGEHQNASDTLLPKNTPFLEMTELCGGEEFHERLEGAAKALLEAEIAYARGEIDKACDMAMALIESDCSTVVLGAGRLLAFSAVWRGDIVLWNDAKRVLREAICKNDNERRLRSLTYMAADGAVNVTDGHPDWLKTGCFDELPSDAHAAARVFYAKYLFEKAFEVATRRCEMPEVKGLALMRMLPYAIEPMITLARAEKTAIVEIHLRMICACAYHNVGNDKKAVEHVDKAVALALPDKLYGVLAEYWHMLDRIVEDSVSKADAKQVRAVKDLYRLYHGGWARLSGLLRNKVIATNLTLREREVARLAAFGFTSKEIAVRLSIAESTVKQTVYNVMQKTGVSDRSKFNSII